MLSRKLEISILNLSDVYKLDVTKRIDSEYFQNKYLEMDSGSYSKGLRFYDDIDVKGGKRLPQGHDFTTERGYPYIRAQDIRNSFITSKNSPLIEKTTFEKLSSYKIEEKDVLVTIVGNSIGDIGFAKNLPKNSVLTENAVAIRSKTLPPEVIFVYLMGKYGDSYIQRNTVGTAQPKLSIERIRQFKYPIITKELSERIVLLVEKAFDKKLLSDSFYQNSENQLLSVFGITKSLITPDFSKKQIAIKTLKQINEADRVDAEYYQPKYDSLIKTIRKNKNKKLIDIVDIHKSIEPGSDFYEDEGIPFVRVADIDKFGINDSKVFLSPEYFSHAITPLKNTILFSKDGTCGIAYKMEDDSQIITSSALLHLIKKDNLDIDLDYLTLMLNSPIVQLQAERDAGGSIINHWRVSQIEQVIVPIADKEIQVNIGESIRKSFTLRRECEKLLKIAQRGVEIAIESSEQDSIIFLDYELSRIN